MRSTQMTPDFERAKSHVLERLAHELPPSLTYHSLQHTRDDVLPAAIRLGLKSGIDDEAMLLLTTAAVFHDIGFIYSYEEHEQESIAVARVVLPEFDYSEEHIERVAALIAATKMPQRPKTPLEQLLCDADLDLLGREDFWELNRRLLAEVHYHRNRHITEKEWLRGQTLFMQEHVYFSVAARALRDEGKLRNVARMQHALLGANGSTAPPLPLNDRQ